MNFTQKVFQITDLIKYIGKFKKQFEDADNIDKLNNTYIFQNLICLIFGNKCEHDSGLIIKNGEDDRLIINICFHNHNHIHIRFTTFQKYQRNPYYFDFILLNKNIIPIDNQYLFSTFIINDSILLPFFKSEKSYII
jgi:hypothetical protein